MSLTLIATAGASDANSYVTLASANSFLEQNIHIFGTWASLTTTNAEASLIYATSLLDAQIDWLGVKKTSSQSLRWPRTDVSDPDEYAVDSDTIPVFLQEATSFYAYTLSQSDRTAESDTLGFTRLDAGSLRMDIDKYDRRETMPVSVYDLIKWYGSKSSGRARVLVRR